MLENSKLVSNFDLVKSYHLRFLSIGVLASFLVACFVGSLNYSELRHTAFDLSAQITLSRLEHFRRNHSQEDEASRLSDIQRLTTHYKKVTRIKRARLISQAQSVVWQSEGMSPDLNSELRLSLSKFVSMNSNYKVLDDGFVLLKVWRDLVGQANYTIPVLVKIENPPQAKSSLIAELHLLMDEAISMSRTFAIKITVYTFAASLLLLLILSHVFKKVLTTVESQESELNHQISRLSDLLELNKGMQQSMKTASSRAVELNERFLRRLGADLHDGPAQMIGYSVLRLNQITSSKDARDSDQEFHLIKEALEQSLEEIRDISSGLVLPALQNMNIEECLRKVVTLHSTKSKAKGTFVAHSKSR